MQPPHRILYDLGVILVSGKLNAAIAKTLTNASIALALALIVGVATARRAARPSRGARDARSAVCDLLRGADLRLLSAADRAVRARRRAADRHRLHAWRGGGDRQHAQRSRPRAARAAQGRAHPAAWPDRDRAEGRTALRRALCSDRRQVRGGLFADRHHRRRVHHVARRHGLRDQLRLQQLRQRDDVPADRADPRGVDLDQRFAVVVGDACCWRGGGCELGPLEGRAQRHRAADRPAGGLAGAVLVRGRGGAAFAARDVPLHRASW